MGEKTMSLTFLLLIIMQQNIGSIEASRLLNIHPPPTIPKSPQAPSHDYWYSINDDKGGDDAFRPTSPGHSPGVGHQTPPP
jgi:hypothetical protein